MKIFKYPVILETACGHDGNVKTLKKLIDIAAKTEAKIIKFQIFNLEERALENTKEHRIFKPLLISEKNWKSIIYYAKKRNLYVFADVYGNLVLIWQKNLKLTDLIYILRTFFNIFYRKSN